MPRKHREFLTAVERVANIRTMVHGSREEPQLYTAYHETLESLAQFRNKHIELVTRYVVVMASRAGFTKGELSNNQSENVMTPMSAAGAMGTGGTKPIEFLKLVRDAVIRASQK
jgi:indoleamine 2,3-dioxygenase